VLENYPPKLVVTGIYQEVYYCHTEAFLLVDRLRLFPILLKITIAIWTL